MFCNREKTVVVMPLSDDKLIKFEVTFSYNFTLRLLIYIHKRSGNGNARCGVLCPALGKRDKVNITSVGRDRWNIQCISIIDTRVARLIAWRMSVHFTARFDTRSISQIDLSHPPVGRISSKVDTAIC